MTARRIARWLNRLLSLVGVRIVRAGAPPPNEAPVADVVAEPESSFWDLGADIGIVRMRTGDLVCIDVRDELIGAPIRVHGFWEPHVTRTLQRLLRPGDTAIEVGSNVGCHVVTIARQVGSAGSLMAIEANPDAADLLTATVGVNRLRNVTIVRQAVLDQPREVELWADPRFLGGGAVALPNWKDDPNLVDWRRHVTQAVTLDSLTEALPRVDLIHMDVEGCELAILAGAERLLARSPNVKIIAEWGSLHAPSYFDINEGLDLLIRHGFHFWKISDDATLLSQTKAEMLAGEFGDVLIARNHPDALPDGSTDRETQPTG